MTPEYDSDDRMIAGVTIPFLALPAIEPEHWRPTGFVDTEIRLCRLLLCQGGGGEQVFDVGEQTR